MCALLFLTGCYQPEEQYTSLESIEIQLHSTEVLADSASRYVVTVKIPGLKYSDTVRATLTTDWGQWPNRSKSITINSVYQDTINAYVARSYLLSDRTPGPFTIAARTSTQLTASIEFSAVPNLPDTIQIVTDSLTMTRKPGSYTTATALFYSKHGYTSYGLRFSFKAGDSVIVVPLHDDYTTAEGVSAKVVIGAETKAGEIEISGTVKNAGGPKPVILPAKVIVKEE